ncbi:MAG: GMC family oxidoreductase, partial [Halieaceae bacterium]|nr:GMC family oxidoreductase [Halieaceae bacterium]
WCDAGCPIGALANPLVTSLPQALKAGAEIRYGAQVLRVLRDSGNAKNIRAVEYAQHGERHQIAAKRFIIAAFTVQTSRILLNSGDSSTVAPGNRHDQLGRYITTHPAGTVFGLFDDETTPHLGVSGGQLLCHDDYADKDQAGGFGSSQWLIANAIKPHDLLGYGTSRPDITGAALRPWLQRAAKHLANMTLVVEDISSSNNRVTLSDSLDDVGMPKAHAHHDIDPDAAARWQQRVEEGEEIFRAAGASEVWHGPRVAMHIMGGTVMGSHEAESVTDEFGRVHDTDNLYVSGPSLFPSSGAVNPTFTLTALAERQADHLLGIPLANP